MTPAHPDRGSGETQAPTTYSAREQQEALSHYFHYIERGINGLHIAPFQEEWAQNALTLIPHQVHRCGSTQL